MRKKFLILSAVNIIVALSIYGFTFFLFHYLAPSGGISPVYLIEPSKPFVTLLFGVWGVLFFFAGFLSLMIALIFFPKNRN